jgi:hypothetical protein
MTQDRFKEIQQMLEAWRETDNRCSDAEKTAVVVELLEAVGNVTECFTPTTASSDLT